MKSFSLGILYIILSFFFVFLLYFEQARNMIEIFVVILSILYLFTKGVDYLLEHFSSR